MATYITTIQFTEKGIGAIQDTTKRANSFKSACKKLNVKVSGTYWTLGPFDGLLIFEADDDTAATAAMLHLSSQGFVRTTTARAFAAGEMEKVISALAGAG